MDKKLIAFLTAAAAVATLLGVSWFGGKSFPDASKDVLKFIGIKTANATNPPNVTNSPIIIIMTPTSEPTLTSSPDNSTATSEHPTNNIPVVVPTTIPDDDIEGHSKSLMFITTTQKPDNHEEENTKENQKDNTENNDSEDNDFENNNSENNDSENNTDISATEKPILANTEKDQTINTKLEISSSGYLMLKSKSSRKQAKKEESTIGISKITDENGNTIETTGFSSFKYSEIVNEDNLEQENGRIYIPVSIGIYIFTFTNCEIEDLDVLFTEYTSTDKNAEKENDAPENENLLVPTQGIWQFTVTQNQPEMSCNFKSEKSFTPLIQFYSEEVNEEEIYITVLDRENNNLQTIKLNQTNENGSYEIMGEFNFIENEEYHLKISSDTELNDVPCFLSFIEIENAE